MLQLLYEAGLLGVGVSLVLMQALAPFGSENQHCV